MSISNFDLSCFKFTYDDLPSRIKKDKSFEQYMRSSSTSVRYGIYQSDIDEGSIWVDSKIVENTQDIQIMSDFYTHCLDVFPLNVIPNLDIKAYERKSKVWINYAHHVIYNHSHSNIMTAYTRSFALKDRKLTCPTIGWPEALKIILDVKPVLDLWITDCHIKYAK